ncbi:hypothetical protein FIBSPDRAFT_349864 [Athelia psychrophila]|uniref:Uncharacterized protein n=1 Tax=Athelia psychrophila TaxID=1759441 RepID=A0A167VYX3_9AGAM|nr:hypothetical protein FIBSPDRAFT_349864 [Fibularhizoctonia sp. CBS 109695]
MRRCLRACVSRVFWKPTGGGRLAEASRLNLLAGRSTVDVVSWMGGAGSRTRCACGRSFMVCCYLRIKTLTNELQPATTTISPSFECSSHSSYPLSRPQRTNHFSYRHAYIHFSLSYLLTYFLLSFKRIQHRPTRNTNAGSSELHSSARVHATPAAALTNPTLTQRHQAHPYLALTAFWPFPRLHAWPSDLTPTSLGVCTRQGQRCSYLASMTVHHPHPCVHQRRSSQVPTRAPQTPAHCTTACAPSSTGERELQYYGHIRVVQPQHPHTFGTLSASRFRPCSMCRAVVNTVSSCLLFILYIIISAPISYHCLVCTSCVYYSSGFIVLSALPCVFKYVLPHK